MPPLFRTLDQFEVPPGRLLLVAQSSREGYGIVCDGERLLMASMTPDGVRTEELNWHSLELLASADIGLRPLAEPLVYSSTSDLRQRLFQQRATTWIEQALTHLLAREPLDEQTTFQCLRGIATLRSGYTFSDLGFGNVALAADLDEGWSSVFRLWSDALQLGSDEVFEILTPMTRFLLSRLRPLPPQAAIMRLYSRLQDANWAALGIRGSTDLLIVLRELLGIEQPRARGRNAENDRNGGLTIFEPGVVIAGLPYEPKLVNHAEIARIVADVGLDIDRDFLQALDEKVRSLLENAIRRARSNGSGSVRKYDL